MSDQKVRFDRGGDSGENNAAAVQPIGDQEFVEPDVQGRPVENLRVRTEVLRREAEDSRYLHDYDRALLLRSDALFTLTETETGSEKYTLSADQDLWVYPALTPGRESGGRWGGARAFVGEQPFIGTDMVNALVLTATRFATGLRGYADTDALGGPEFSFGANRLQVRIVADPTLTAGQVRFSIDGDPRVKVTIRHGSLGGVTTLSQLAFAITGDSNGFGFYGMRHLVEPTIAPGSSGSAPAPTCGWTEFRGAYDAEAHQVTAAQIDAFFAIEDNALGEGHGLALSYVSGLVASGDAAPIGGRRQSIWDLPTDREGSFIASTTPATGYLLFNTNREPEKIPGAIPLAKMLEGRLIFADGTILRPGLPVYLGDSTRTIDRYASQAPGASGASLVGYDESPTHNAYTLDDATTLRRLPTGTLKGALDAVVENFGRRTLNDSGAQRVGSHALTGEPTVGNRALSLAQGSLRQQIIELLNKIDGSGRVLGINGRVQENGHRMRGPDPLHKPFYDAGFSNAGGVFLQSELHAPANMMAATPAGMNEFASLSFQPIVYTNPGDADDVLPELNFITASTATTVIFSGMTTAQFTKVFAKMPLVMPNATPGEPVVPLLYARLADASGAADAEDGYYAIVAYNTGTKAVTLKKLDNTNPDFTGLGAGATMTLQSVVAIGNDYRYTRLRAMLCSDLASDFSGVAPWAVFGARRKEAALADTYVADGQYGKRMMRLYADHVDFLGFNPASPSTPVSRNSHNILASGDKVLLDGVETSLPVDATANHTHGTFYAMLPVVPPLAAAAFFMATIATTAGGYEVAVTPDVGRAIVSVVIRYTITLKSAAAGRVYHSLVFQDEDASVYCQLDLEFTAAGIGSTHDFNGQVVVPIRNDHYYIRASPIPVNVDPSAPTCPVSLAYIAQTQVPV